MARPLAGGAVSASSGETLNTSPSPSGHIWTKTEHIQAKTGHIRANSGHIQAKTEHIAGAMVNTCLSNESCVSPDPSFPRAPLSVVIFQSTLRLMVPALASPECPPLRPPLLLVVNLFSRPVALSGRPVTDLASLSPQGLRSATNPENSDTRQKNRQKLSLASPSP